MLGRLRDATSEHWPAKVKSWSASEAIGSELEAGSEVCVGSRIRGQHLSVRGVLELM